MRVGNASLQTLSQGSSPTSSPSLELQRQLNVGKNRTMLGIIYDVFPQTHRI